MEFKEKYGEYALITGASSGIGEEFAKQLAEKGLNLILVARRKEKLEKLSNKLEKEHNVKVIALGVDLLSENFIEEIKKVTDFLNVGLLVINAGMMYIGNYLDNSLENDLKMIELNIKAPAILTHHFAKKMVDRKKGRNNLYGIYAWLYGNTFFINLCRYKSS